MLSNFIIQASSKSPWGWHVDGVLKIQKRGKILHPTPVATLLIPSFLWGIFPSNPALWCLYLHVHGSPSSHTSEMSAVLAKGCVVFSETTSWAWVSTWKHHLLHLLLHQVTDIRTQNWVTAFASMCRKLPIEENPELGAYEKIGLLHANNNALKSSELKHLDEQ